MAGSCALIKAVGLLRLDEHEPRPIFLMVLPEIAADARGEAADAPLNEHVCEWARLATNRRRGFDDFGRNDGVALHDISRYGLVAFIRSVRYHLPAFRHGQASRLFDGSVIIAGDAIDLDAAARPRP